MVNSLRVFFMGLRRALLCWSPLLLVVSMLAPSFWGSSADAQTLADLKGLDQKAIESQLGPPDERRGAGDGRESWIYGSSVLLFRDGLVTAWSDAGELTGRRNMAKVKKSEPDDSPKSSLVWQDPWTPSQGVDAARVIDELKLRVSSQPKK